MKTEADEGRAIPTVTQVSCARRNETVDIERCFSCGVPCVAAQHSSGRSPDRDVEWYRLVRDARIGSF